jgi:hypothetical protein
VVGEVKRLLRRQVIQIKLRDIGIRIGIDDDHLRAIGLPLQRNTRKTVPANKFLAAQPLALGELHVDE